MPLLARVVLEDALAAEAGLGVFADGPVGVRLQAAARGRGDEGIDVAGREDDDPRAGVAAGHVPGNDRVHGPGEVRAVRGAELHPGQEEDVREVGQALDLRGVEQVAGDGLDPRVLRGPLATPGEEKRETRPRAGAAGRRP